MKKFSEQIIRGKFQKLPAFFGSFSTYFSEFEKIEEKLNLMRSKNHPTCPLKQLAGLRYL